MKIAFLIAALAWAAGARAASINIDSNVSNLPVTVDDKTLRTLSVLRWAYHRVQRAIAAEPAGTRYQFLKWTDSADPYARTITARADREPATGFLLSRAMSRARLFPPRFP